MKLKSVVSALFIFVLSWGSSFAQDNFITIDDLKDREAIAELSGKASVVFQSPHDNLVVTSSNKSIDEALPRRIVKQAGKGTPIYEYEFLLNLSNGTKRTFTVSRQGAAISTEVKKVFKSNKRYYYNVEEVEKPITLIDQSRLSNSHLVNNQACVEFTTSLDKFAFLHRPADNLCCVKESKNSAGAHVYSLIITDYSAFDNLRQSFVRAQFVADSLEDSRLTAMEKGDDALVSRLDKEVEKANEALQTVTNQWNSASSVSIAAQGTNSLTVTFENLELKKKISYGILVLNEKVFASPYDEKMAHAAQATEAKEYQQAANSYNAAAQLAGITPEQKALAESLADEMVQCNEFVVTIKRNLALVKMFKDNHEMVKVSDVEDAYHTAIVNAELLARRRNDPYYADLAKRWQRALDRMEFIVEGVTLRSEFHQGLQRTAPLAEVKIIGRKGEEDVKVIGESDAEGKFHLQIEPGTYTSLKFEYRKKDKKFRPYVVPLEGKKHLKIDIKLAEK